MRVVAELIPFWRRCSKPALSRRSRMCARGSERDGRTQRRLESRTWARAVAPGGPGQVAGQGAQAQDWGGSPAPGYECVITRTPQADPQTTRTPHSPPRHTPARTHGFSLLGRAPPTTRQREPGRHLHTGPLWSPAQGEVLAQVSVPGHRGHASLGVRQLAVPVRRSEVDANKRETQS